MAPPNATGFDANHACKDSTVLVIDDEAGERQRIRRTLEGAGVHVVETESYMEARPRLESGEADAVLVDLLFDYPANDERLLPAGGAGATAATLHVSRHQGALICQRLREDMAHDDVPPMPVVMLTNHPDPAIEVLNLVCWSKEALQQWPQEVLQQLGRLIETTRALAHTLARLEPNPIAREQVIAEVAQSKLPLEDVRQRLEQLTPPVEIAALYRAVLGDYGPPRTARQASSPPQDETATLPAPDLFAPEPPPQVQIALTEPPAGSPMAEWWREHDLGVCATLEPTKVEIWTRPDDLLRGQAALAHLTNGAPEEAGLRTYEGPGETALNYISNQVTIVVDHPSSPSKAQGRAPFRLRDVCGPRLFQALFRPKRESDAAALIPLVLAHSLLLEGKQAGRQARQHGWLTQFEERLTNSTSLTVGTDALRSELLQHAERWERGLNAFHKLNKDSGRSAAEWAGWAYDHLLAAAADRPDVQGLVAHWFSKTGPWRDLPHDAQEACRKAAARAHYLLLDDPWIEARKIGQLLRVPWGRSYIE